MINEFISGDKNTRVIEEFFETKEPLKCAVAFWGEKAWKLLENSKSSEIRIICNLESGATNPFLMEKLLKLKKEKPLNIHIKTKHNLHAKVYIAGNQAIIGSSNVSSNGLSLEDEEQKGYEEASIITSDEKIIESANAWFEELWESSLPIHNRQLEKIKEQWRIKRNTRLNIVGSEASETTIFEVLTNNSLIFKDRNIYIVICGGHATKEAEDKFNEIKKEVGILSEKLAFFEISHINVDNLPKNSFQFIIVNVKFVTINEHKIIKSVDINSITIGETLEKPFIKTFKYQNGTDGIIFPYMRKDAININLTSYKLSKTQKKLLNDKIKELDGDKVIEMRGIIPLYDIRDLFKIIT